MRFFDRVATLLHTHPPLVVGLDPRPDELTPDERAELARDPASALIAHGERLLDATAEHAVAWKPNLAFYEAWGSAGWRALEHLVPRLSAVAPVLLDGKRGDIGSTASAYAEAALKLGAHAVTLSPYLGEDAVRPFLDAGLDVFVLARTSNPSAASVQDAPPTDPLWTQLLRRACTWAPADRLGFVVAATAPAALATAHALAPDRWLLAPGVGAQGADLATTLAAAHHDPARPRLLVPVSRAISGADDPAAAAAALAHAMRAARPVHAHAVHLDTFTSALASEAPLPAPPAAPAPHTPHAPPTDAAAHAPIPHAHAHLVTFEASLASASARVRPEAPHLSREHLADLLFDRGCVRFGEFRLKSGALSPIYLDLRRLIAHPDLLTLVAAHLTALVGPLDHDVLAALPYAALPIGTAVSIASGKAMIYPRREAKDYGTQAVIEGEYTPGMRALVLDDVATRGDSKLEAFDRLEAAGLVVHDVAVLIDREGGARELLAARGKGLHAVFTLRELLVRWHETGRVGLPELEAVHRFLAT